MASTTEVPAPNATADDKPRDIQAAVPSSNGNTELILKEPDGAAAAETGAEGQVMSAQEMYENDAVEPLVPNNFNYTEQKPAPKNKSRSIAARGEGAMPKWRGTGYEENYCDPPISPEEYDEEKEVYASYLPFHERIQECIQRYRARRRMNSGQTDTFTKYLLVGGIDAMPRMFTGSGAKAHGKHVFGDATKAEIRTMTANDVIQKDPLQSRFYNPEEPEHWDVDFTGVAAGFITTTLIDVSSCRIDLINAGIDIVCNFLRYVHMHSVCPEYTDDITLAIKTALAAKTEIPMTMDAFKALPGSFNLAARQLFWDRKPNDFYLSINHTAMKLDDLNEQGFDAERVFKSTIAIWGGRLTEESYTRTMDIDAVKIKTMYMADLELIGVRFPETDMKFSYAGVRDRATGAQRCIEPCGYARFKHTIIEDGYDLPAVTEKRGNEDVFLEESIIGSEDNPGPLMPGMKMRAVVCELDSGLKYLIDVLEVKPSMYTFLPQELMLHYKEPVDNERPAPSVQNPHADEEELGRLLEEETKGEE